MIACPLTKYNYCWFLTMLLPCINLVAFNVQREYDSKLLPLSNHIPTRDDTQHSGRNRPYRCSGKLALNILAGITYCRCISCTSNCASKKCSTVSVSVYEHFLTTCDSGITTLSKCKKYFGIDDYLSCHFGGWEAGINQLVSSIYQVKYLRKITGYI